MFLSFLVPILSGIFGASTTTAIVGTVTTAVTAVGTASASEVIAVACLVGAAKGMSKNTEKNKFETKRIYKEINEKKSLVNQNYSEEKNRIEREKKEAESDFKKNYRKQSMEEFDKLVSSRLEAKRRFARISKG